MSDVHTVIGHVNVRFYHSDWIQRYDRLISGVNVVMRQVNIKCKHTNNTGKCKVLTKRSEG